MTHQGIEQALRRERKRQEAQGRSLAWWQGFGAGEENLNPYPRGDIHRAEWQGGKDWKNMVISHEKEREQ